MGSARSGENSTLSAIADVPAILPAYYEVLSTTQLIRDLSLYSRVIDLLVIADGWLHLFRPGDRGSVA